MSSMIQTIWTNAVRPLLQRPPALQLAALCHRATKGGKEVLLISSSSGRWILPKGWPIDGLTAAQAAKQEARSNDDNTAGLEAPEQHGQFDLGHVLEGQETEQGE